MHLNRGDVTAPRIYIIRMLGVRTFGQTLVRYAVSMSRSGWSPAYAVGRSWQARDDKSGFRSHLLHHPCAQILTYPVSSNGCTSATMHPPYATTRVYHVHCGESHLGTQRHFQVYSLKLRIQHGIPYQRRSKVSLPLTTDQRSRSNTRKEERYSVIPRHWYSRYALK